jgi:hypothetical protein
MKCLDNHLKSFMLEELWTLDLGFSAHFRHFLQ